MLSIEIFKRASSKALANEYISSKKIPLDNDREAIFQISLNDKSLAGFIENTALDLILTNTGKNTDAYTALGYLLEILNKNFRELERDYSLEGMKVFLGIIDKNTLHFSILGSSSVYLVKNEKILNIAEGMEGKSSEFSYISSGAINQAEALYISNNNILDYLTQEDLIEIASFSKEEEKVSMVQSLLEREVDNGSTEVILLSNIDKRASVTSGPSFSQEKLSLMLDVIKNNSIKLYKKAQENDALKDAITKAKTVIDFENKYIRVAFFSLGIIVAVGLLYAIISSLFIQRIDKAVPEEYKNKLIEAQIILDKAGKDLGNKEVFAQNIKKAEDIIYEVRNYQVGNNPIFINDVKKLLDHVAILKKQMNGVESFDPKNTSAEYVFAQEDFGLKSIFEISKKLYFVGKNGIIGPYIKGGEAKVYAYPDGEEAIGADASAEGQIYVFTKTNRVLRFNKGEYTYINVEGQKTWENGTGIKTFNSNLYVLSDTGNQIFKHKPGVNGFSSKSTVLGADEYKNTPIYDFAIDGGFYILKNNLTIDKVFTVPSYSKKSIIINNLPDNYSQKDATTQAKLITGQNLNYLYMILDNKVWIFQPDTKNYRDVKAVRYVGQIEVVDGKVQAIYVEKDGEMYVGTSTGIYAVRFEVADNKIVIR